MDVSKFELNKSKTSLTDQELSVLDKMSVEEIKEMILFHEKQFNYYKATEQGLKTALNSIYGAFGNKHFVCSTTDISFAITAMGRDLIRYMDKINETYWYEHWHNDTELHQKLGIENPKQIDSAWIHRESKVLYDGEVTDEDIINGLYQRRTPVSLYADTDSVHKDTIIRTDKGIMTIEDLYNWSESQNNSDAGSTVAGHSSVKTEAKCLNWSKEKGLYYANIKRVIKHKVSKQKWELKTKSGKIVIVTNDHSLIVFRNGQQVMVKPSEVTESDWALIIKNNNILNSQYDQIVSCQSIGHFDDEWVYDIEVDDETHTFIADDILVHNSSFVGFNPGIQSCNWPEGSEQKFIEIVSKERIEPLFKKKLDSYAKRYGVKNIEDFELENINESVLFLAKKSYIKHTIWEDGVQYERLKNLVPKNVSLIKRGTPPFARTKVFEIINYIFDNHKNIKLNQILKFVIDQRKQFEMVDNKDDITQSTSLNMYLSHKLMVDGLLIDGPGVVNDKDKLVYGKSTYVTVKAAGLYNYCLNQRPDLKIKYENLGPGVKVKIYPCKHELNDKFAYPLGTYPHEFAPEIDYDTLFEKTVSAQVNIFMKALGLPELNKRLKIIMPIF